MANKYLIQGATYCGTGTSSAEATSNGGTGAWNNINVLEGTAPAYGTLAAGDVVNIRSKTIAGADITRTVGANIVLGSASATLAAPITWVLDQGAIWSGIAGTLTYDTAAGNYTTEVRAHNVIHTPVEDKIVFQITYASYYAYWFTVNQGTVLSNCWFRMDAVTLNSNGPSGVQAVGNQNGFSQLINPRISVGAKLFSKLFAASSYSTLHVSTPRITLAASVAATPLFVTSGSSATLKVFGGSISGVTSGQVLCQQGNPDGNIEFHGTAIPNNVIYTASPPSGAQGDQRIDGWGVDGGVGSFSARGGGVIDSRQDGYYPSLNGTYPNSTNQAWAWKVTPSNASLSNPLDVLSCLLYTGAAAAKTITVEMLIADAFIVAGTAGKGKVWLEVSYIDDATGATKSINSAAFGSTAALDTSTASWTTDTYGATQLRKRKISLTTPTSIKQNTLITAVLRWAEKAVSTTDIAFVDPEPVLT